MAKKCCNGDEGFWKKLSPDELLPVQFHKRLNDSADWDAAVRVNTECTGECTISMDIGENLKKPPFDTMSSNELCCKKIVWKEGLNRLFGSSM